MTDQIKIEMDISAEWYDTAEMHNEFAQFDISFELIELVGPGGGNPNIWVIGKESNIREWLAFAEYDEDDIEYHINGE
jgi:hypothetical protein